MERKFTLTLENLSAIECSLHKARVLATHVQNSMEEFARGDSYLGNPSMDNIWIVDDLTHDALGYMLNDVVSEIKAVMDVVSQREAVSGDKKAA